MNREVIIEQKTDRPNKIKLMEIYVLADVDLTTVVAKFHSRLGYSGVDL
jgi:hypothetical protein